MLRPIMRRVRGLDPAARLLAVIALCFALGGTAYAAKTITGKNVKDSSLTGKDIKDGSLSPVDFSGSVKGDQGPQGPQGQAGPAGSALAYARVSGGQGSATVDVAVSSGITVATNAQQGAYCLDYSAGTARNVQIAVDASGATQNATAFVTALPASVQAANCPAGADILVRTYNSGSTQNQPFYIAVIA